MTSAMRAPRPGGTRTATARGTSHSYRGFTGTRLKADGAQ